MANVIQRGIETLIQNGLVELLIFALVFALVYGILNMIKIFGDEDEAKRYNVLIAVSFGILAIVPSFIAPGSAFDIVPIVTQALPQTMLIALAALSIIIVLGLFGMETFHQGKSWSWIIGLIVLGLIIWIFTGATGAIWGLPYWLTPDLIAALLAVLVFAGIIFFVMGGEEKEGESGG